MKLRLGGVLAIALGAVLIGNGLSTSADGSVGVLPPNSTCGATNVGGLTPAGNCPVGTIQITDTTPSGTGVPADWDVTVTSTCLDPATGLPVNVTLTVPTGNSVTSGNLYIFTQLGATASSPKCSYALTREVNPLFTATFTPASPVTLPFADTDGNPAQRRAQVTLLNTAVVAPTTTAAPTTAAPTTSAAPSSTASDPATGAVGTPVYVSNSAAPASDTQDAAPIADTGPRESITASLWLGIGLVLLGLFLVFEGRIRTLGKHRD